MARRVVITGAAGFLGSHLADACLARGDEVVGIDNFATGYQRNIAHLDGDDSFSFVEHDIVEPLKVDGPVDLVLNFASPASPPRYVELSLETLRVGSYGVDNMARLAIDKGARLVHASTSEVYGDPLVHPQVEEYWGHVNPIGMRSMYDESKRFAEAMLMAHHRQGGLDLGLVRIFNTYGPRLAPDDGRVVSNFLRQAIRGEALTIYGPGDQTRSFCYVDDEVRGILALADSDQLGPINIGNPNEFTILELAEVIQEVLGIPSPIEFRPLPNDDPTQRQPDITKARELLGWEPAVALREGIARTAEWFRIALA